MLVILVVSLLLVAMGFVAGCYNTKLLDEDKIFKLQNENESLNKELNIYKSRGRKR